jgi:hypothetical protein
LSIIFEWKGPSPDFLLEETHMFVYNHNTARETTGAAAQIESQQAANSKPKRKTDHP